MKKIITSLFVSTFVQFADVAAAGQMLESVLQSDPDNLKYLFYLAQKYQDEGEFEKALTLYEKCITKHTKSNEARLALLQIAIMKEDIGANSKEVIDSYKQASAFLEYPIESLYYLSLYARKIHQHETSYDAASQGLVLEPPKDVLFFKDWIYDYGMLFEYTLSAYWTGRFLEAELASQLALLNSNLPSNVKSNLEKVQTAAQKKMAASLSQSRQNESALSEIKALYLSAQNEMKSNHFQKAYELSRKGLILVKSLPNENKSDYEDLLAIYWLTANQTQHFAEAFIASKLLFANSSISPQILGFIKRQLEKSIGKSDFEAVTESSDASNDEEEIATLDFPSYTAILEDPISLPTETFIDEREPAPRVLNVKNTVKEISPNQDVSSYFIKTVPFDDSPVHVEPITTEVNKTEFFDNSPVNLPEFVIENDYPAQQAEYPVQIRRYSPKLAGQVYSSIHYGKGLANTDPYGTVGGYADWQSGCLQPFVDLRGHYFKGEQWATNAGMGLRFVDQRSKLLCGINAFYDYRHKHHDFQQLGLGLELSFGCFDMFANYYIPLGKKYFYNDVVTFDYPGGYYAIRKERVDLFCGQDIEIGTSLNRWCRQSCVDVYLGLGAYHYNNRNGSRESFTGGKYTLEVSFLDYLIVGLNGTYDDMYKNTLQGYVTVSIPFDGCGGSRPFVRQRCFLNRFSGRPVQRNPIILESRPTCHWETNF